MRKLFSVILLVWSLAAMAQVTPYDRLVFADQDLMGTSRYVGMGGAMAAIGGDASAAGDNPAGLGLYRRSELMVTLDYQRDVPNLGYQTGKFSCGQASWNFCFAYDRMKGMVSNNVMLTYRRVKNFKRDYAMRLVDMDYSQTDVMAYKTYGLAETALQGEHAWYDSEVGWLSKMGYEGYLIDPDSVEPGLWFPSHTGNVTGELNVQESGSIDEFAFLWGMNISNEWYIGAELGMRSLTYNKSAFYNEVFADGSRYSLDTYIGASGVGMLSKLGLLYRPTRFLRFGASVHAPVPTAFSLHNYAELRTSNGTYVESLENNHSPSWYIQPMRVVTGLAFQIGNYGLVSMEYDFQHDLEKGTPDTHWGKLGLEGVVANNWFINLGYAMKLRQLTGGKLSDPIQQISYNSVRTDTEFSNLQYAHYISGGFSFRHKYVVAGLAYQCCLKGEKVHFHEFQSTPIALNTATHRIVLSLSWRR